MNWLVEGLTGTKYFIIKNLSPIIRFLEGLAKGFGIVIQAMKNHWRYLNKRICYVIDCLERWPPVAFPIPGPARRSSREKVEASSPPSESIWPCHFLQSTYVGRNTALGLLSIDLKRTDIFSVFLGGRPRCHVKWSRYPTGERSHRRKLDREE